jgi:hypothetical protein
MIVVSIEREKKTCNAKKPWKNLLIKLACQVLAKKNSCFCQPFETYCEKIK